MSKTLKIGIVGFLIVVALGVLITGTVLAQDDPPKPENKPFGWFGKGGGFGFGHLPGKQVGLEAAAEVLGMTTDELSTALWGGKTLADLADEAGVAVEDVQAVVSAAVELVKREAIEQAVEDGKLTREHADWLLEGFDKGFIGGHGGGGFGGHGFYGRRGFQGGFGGLHKPAGPSGTLGADA
jgi:hypothetical protein